MPLSGLILPLESDRSRAEKKVKPTRCLDGSMTLRHLAILRLYKRPPLRESASQYILNLAAGRQLGNPGTTCGDKATECNEDSQCPNSARHLKAA